MGGAQHVEPHSGSGGGGQALIAVGTRGIRKMAGVGPLPRRRRPFHCRIAKCTAGFLPGHLVETSPRLGRFMMCDAYICFMASVVPLRQAAEDPSSEALRKLYEADMRGERDVPVKSTFSNFACA